MKVRERAIYLDREGGCWLWHYALMSEWLINNGYQWTRKKYFYTLEDAIQQHPDVEVRVGAPGIDPDGTFSRLLRGSGNRRAKLFKLINVNTTDRKER